MLCLHGEKATSSTTKDGTFWFCNKSDKCRFVCSDELKDLYEAAIKTFLETKQPLPKCCMGEKTPRTHAEMKVVTDMNKANFGRPFFKCPKRDNNCDYFKWGDQIILEKPLCLHRKPSRLLRVKKEGPNKDRCFFCCAEKRQDNKCQFFEWFKGPDPEDPLMPGSICLFSMPPSYKYTLKKNGAMFTSCESDRKKAYEEFVHNNEKTDPPNIHQATHIAFLRAGMGIGESDLFGKQDSPVQSTFLRTF